MSKSKYKNDIYSMYEKEYLKVKKLEEEKRNLKSENDNLKYELAYRNRNFDKKVKSEVEKAGLLIHRRK